MKHKMDLVCDGEVLTTWIFPQNWLPSFGTILCVPIEGKLTNFFSCGMTATQISLQRAEKRALV